MKSKEAQYRAISKFQREKMTAVLLRLNKNTDADVIRKLDAVPSKMGYIKELIRQDIEKHGFM